MKERQKDFFHLWGMTFLGVLVFFRASVTFSQLAYYTEFRPCEVCSRTGACDACVGQSKVSCGICGGRGVIEAPEAVRCTSCGGDGKWGWGDLLPCFDCNSTGSVSRKVMKSCWNCAGTGTVDCGKCSGSGKCKVCTGERAVRISGSR